MPENPPVSAQTVVQKALSEGAALAGIASAEAIEQGPSHQTCGRPRWPKGSKAVLVLALAHPSAAAWMDWWDRRPEGTPGNRELDRICRRIMQWLESDGGIGSHLLPYHVEKGGVFLKDSAALAGLGAIGRNNLLITPAFGPRVRLRALWLEQPLTPTGPTEFDPCRGCPAPCLSACPRNAFGGEGYSRVRCTEQMQADVAGRKRVRHPGSGGGRIRAVQYCRACELSCVVGGTGPFGAGGLLP
jgi:epoxyqueuosine reductase